MKIKCLIVDDEPLAIKLIENHISKINSLEVIGTCNSALKALEFLNTQDIDLLFLDIKMPSISGIDFLKTLQTPPKTIFTTAYRDYAIDSYDLEAVDYLLKPITFERFLKSINRFLRNNKPSSPEKNDSQKEDYIVVKSGNKYHKLSIKTIVYIESFKDYIKINTTDNQKIISKYRISDIEQELKEKQFLRVHRSYIININKINAFTVNYIEVSSVEIPIGISYKNDVITFLDTIKKK